MATNVRFYKIIIRSRLTLNSYSKYTRILECMGTIFPVLHLNYPQYEFQLEVMGKREQGM